MMCSSSNSSRYVVHMIGGAIETASICDILNWRIIDEHSTGYEVRESENGKKGEKSKPSREEEEEEK